MVGGSLRVLWLLPPLKLATMISLNIAEIGTKTPKIKSKTNRLIIGVPSEGYCPGCSIFSFLCSVL
jgi:hypothetical protein